MTRVQRQNENSAVSLQTRFSHEMGITRAEFLRTLPAAVGEQRFTVVDDSVRIEEGTRRLLISLENQRERVIGSLRLPILTVNFEFRGYASDEVERFMERFMLYFHRGGG